MPPRRLVLDLDGVDHLLLLGLRCLVVAHQRLDDVESVLAGTRPAVAETVRLGAFDSVVSIQDRVAVY